MMKNIEPFEFENLERHWLISQALMPELRGVDLLWGITLVKETKGDPEGLISKAATSALVGFNRDLLENYPKWKATKA